MRPPGSVATGCLLTLALAAPLALAQPIHGAGTPFARALYDDLAEAYRTRGGVKVVYETLPPEEVVKRLRAGQLDFGTLFFPLSVAELQAKGLVQFPVAIGGLVVIANTPGVAPGALRLDGARLADMFQGRIKTWDDPAIAAINPGLPLPAAAIRVVHPAEPSAATFAFTRYLSSQSRGWEKAVGAGLVVRWPGGLVRAEGDALIRYVQTTTGAVGFADYAAAVAHGVAKAKLQNHALEFVAPNVVSFQTAAASAPWETTPAFAVVLVDPAAPGSWPLSIPAFTLLPLVPRDPGRVVDVLRFFKWSFEHGGELVRDEGYAVVPSSLATLVEKAWKRQLKTPGGDPIWTGP